MISLPCSSCKKVLQIDDAFAGGVCRCQFCGTIQTVPSSLKNNNPSTVGAPAAAGKTLYQRKTRAAATAGGDASAGGHAAGGAAASSPIAATNAAGTVTVTRVGPSPDSPAARVRDAAPGEARADDGRPNLRMVAIVSVVVIAVVIIVALAVWLNS